MGDSVRVFVNGTTVVFAGMALVYVAMRVIAVAVGAVTGSKSEKGT